MQPSHGSKVQRRAEKCSKVNPRGLQDSFLWLQGGKQGKRAKIAFLGLFSRCWCYSWVNVWGGGMVWSDTCLGCQLAQWFLGLHGLASQRTAVKLKEHELMKW